MMKQKFLNQEDYYEMQKVKGQSFSGTAKIILQYLINDMKKKPRSFKIGFLSAIQSAFQLSPVIFLSIGEDQVGDADMVMTPISFQNSSIVESQSGNNNNNASPFGRIRLLNSSEISQSCDNVDRISGCSPRWVLLGNLYNSNVTSPFKQKFRSYIITIDSIQGLGRRFKGDVLEKGQAYVTATTMRGLGLEEGDNITLNLDIVEAMLKNEGLLNLNLKNQTNEAVQESLTSMVKQLLDQQFPLFVGTDGQQGGLTKNQIVQVTDRIKDISAVSDNPIAKNLLYSTLQVYLDSQNIKINAKDTFDPIISNGNFTNAADDLNQQAKALPDNYVLESQTIANTVTPILMRALNITLDFDVLQQVESPKGKWASALGNTIVVDSKFILANAWTTISSNIEDALNNVNSNDPNINLLKLFYSSFGLSKTISDNLSTIDLNQYAITSNAVFTNRMEIYSGQTAIKRNIVQISNDFSKDVGKSAPIQSTVPLATTVQGLLILKMFLDNMIATSIFLLFMLAVLLIYSLMISDVEEKTYEFGMLRALGFQKSSLIYLLILEGLIFAIPGLALGLLMAYLLNSMIAYIIFNQSMTVTSYELHWSAVVLAFGLGIFIPLISVYLPIQRAMSKTLRDSLDLYHRVLNQISISVQKLERLGISFSQFINSITLILMGVVCYYFAPAAFVYQDIALFLAIINIVLILMIIGFTLLLNLTQPYVEKLFVKLFLCFMRQQKHLEPIIIKNMEGHRRRNGKTALMYTVALSFLIFAGTGFNLQSKSIVDNLKSSLGSDIKILLLNDKTGLDEYGMRQFLDGYVKQYPDNIQAYSFITLPIDSFPYIGKPKFSSLSQFPTNRNLQLRGVEQNYLSSAYLDFYYPTQFDPKMSFKNIKTDSSYKDAVYGLYTNEGLQKLDNSVDYFKIASNSDIRDQRQMGGGEDTTPDDDTSDNQNDNNNNNNGGSSNTNSTTTPISRDKFEDQEIKLIVPSGLHYISSVDVTTPCLLNFDTIKYRARIRSTAKKFPGFRFSSYRQISFYGEILTGTEQFKYLVDSIYYYTDQTDDPVVKEFFSKVQPNSTYGLPKNSLNVQFKRSLSRTEREQIGNGLRNYFKSDFTQLFDVPSIIQQVQDTLFFIDLFSLVVAAISIILSFFLILVSFVSNIKENSWEFGVLRAIGLSKVQITRVYMIESCSLVLASGTIGTIIGLTVAITLTLQLLMFTELPFNFVFPYTMFFTTFFFGLFIAAAASYTALSEFKDKPISSIVKGLI